MIPKKYKSKKRLPLSKDTTFDRIFAHYAEDFEISEKDNEILQRWKQAWSLLNQYNSTFQTKKILAEDFGISERQALRDVNNAIRLYGDVIKSNKEGYRQIIFEYSMKAFQFAAQNLDIGEMNRAVTNMIKIKGLDKEDPEKIDWEKLEQHEIRITLPRNVTKAMQKIVEQGAIDLDDLLDIQDAEVVNVEEQKKD